MSKLVWQDYSAYHRTSTGAKSTTDHIFVDVLRFCPPV